MALADVKSQHLNLQDEEHYLDILPANSTHQQISGVKRPAPAARCPNGNGFTVEIKLNNGNIRYIPDRCDKWCCSYCSPIKARMIAGRLHQTLGKVPFYMVKEIVLDIATAKMTIQDADKTITKEWNKLKAAMVRKYGKFGFFWVKDFTEAGYIHLHILVVTGKDIDPVHLNQHYTIGTATVALAGTDQDKLRRKINYLIKRLREAVNVKAGKKRYGSSRNFLVPKQKSSNSRLLRVNYDKLKQQLQGQIKVQGTDGEYIEV